MINEIMNTVVDFAIDELRKQIHQIEERIKGLKKIKEGS